MAWCWYNRMWLITDKQDFEECSSKVCTCAWCMGCRMVERWQLNDPENLLNYVHFGETPDLCDVWEGIWEGLKPTLTMNGTQLSARDAIEMRRKTYFAATPAPNAKQRHVPALLFCVRCHSNGEGVIGAHKREASKSLIRINNTTTTATGTPSNGKVKKDKRKNSRKWMQSNGWFGNFGIDRIRDLQFCWIFKIKKVSLEWPRCHFHGSKLSPTEAKFNENCLINIGQGADAAKPVHINVKPHVLSHAFCVESKVK